MSADWFWAAVIVCLTLTILVGLFGLFCIQMDEEGL